MARRLAVYVLASMAMGAVLLAQEPGFVRVSEQQARSAVAASALEAKGDADRFSSAFMSEIRKLSPTYTGQPATIHYSAAISVVLMGPVELFQFAAKESVRKMEALPTLGWPPGFIISVSPSQIDAPDIVKIVVTRDGAIIQPITSNLKATEMTTRMGAKRLIHSGETVYSPEAFLPGATVVVTAIPDSGRNIVKTFTDAELRKLQ